MSDTPDAPGKIRTDAARDQPGDLFAGSPMGVAGTERPLLKEIIIKELAGLLQELGNFYTHGARSLKTRCTAAMNSYVIRWIGI